MSQQIASSPFTDIFAIQDKVSQQVAQRLRLKLSPAQQARLTKRFTSNPEAYNIARIHALGGKSEEAVKWLRVTVKEGFPSYPLFARDPFLNPIRKDPAFLQFLAEMKTRWEGYQREFG